MTRPHFNHLVEALSAPPIPAIAQWANLYDGCHGPLIDLSQAVPGYAPHPQLLEALAQAAGSARYAGYGPIEGEEKIRSAYAQHLNETYDSNVSTSEIHITSGCNQAFTAAVMALIGPGESVLLLNPFYFNHQTTLAMLGIGTVTVDCHADQGFVPQMADIAKALNPTVRAIVLISPNNPTGAVYSSELLQTIYALCCDRGLWLLVDETYRDFLPLSSTTPPHGLFSQTGWQNNLVGLYSFSKSFCIPGHRLGALTASEAVVTQVAKVMDNLQICAPRAPQAAVAKGLNNLADWRAGNRREIASRAAIFRRTMAASPAWRLDSLGAYFAYVILFPLR